MSVVETTAYKTLTALSEDVELAVGGFASIGIQLGGTWVGTVTFEGTIDTGDWQTFNATKTNSSSPATTATANGIWIGSVSGLRKIRVRVSAFTSGRINVQLLATGEPAAGAGGGGGAGSNVNLIEVGGTAIALGQALMASSLPVAIASDQDPIPVTGSISATNPSVGPTGDPIPVEATLIGAEDETGDLQGVAAPVLDYNTGAGTQRQTVFGIGLPSASGTVAGGTATNPIRTDPTGTTTQPVSAASLPLPTGAATEATLASLNGKVTTVNTGAVVVSSSALPTGAATEATLSAINGKMTAGAGAVGSAVQRVVLATDTTVPNVTGNIAHDAADSGNPLKVGMVAFSPDGTTPGTAVAEGDRTNAKGDLNGRFFTNGRSPWTWDYHSNGSSPLTDDSVQGDPGDGFQIVITEIIFSTGSAVAGSIVLKVGGTAVFGPWYTEAVAGRGVFWQGEKKIAASSALTVTTTGTAMNFGLDIQGYIQAV